MDYNYEFEFYSNFPQKKLSQKRIRIRFTICHLFLACMAIMLFGSPRVKANNQTHFCHRTKDG